MSTGDPSFSGLARSAGPAVSEELRVVTFTSLFPNPAQPRLGVFVRDRVLALSRLCPTVVVAPVLSRFGLERLELAAARSVPLRESASGLEIHHPRFNSFPGIGRGADAVLLYVQTLPLMRRIRRNFAFDVIDAHYAFPDGAAAVLLGRRFGVPVSVTVRGGDIDLLPRFRVRRRVIQWTLRHADRVIAVSEHLARGARALGAPPDQLRIVPNGIDRHTFFRVDQATARHTIGVQAGSTSIICVANLHEEKGQHVLVEAVGRLRERGGRVPEVYIIGSQQRGGGWYQRQLERRIHELGLSERVHFVGSKTQNELRSWYSAADLLVLPTFREGCPNVVREALACGTPVVASRVGGVPELLGSERLGLMVPSGDSEQLATTVDAALRRSWDRDAIAATSGSRTWSTVGELIRDELAALVAERRALACDDQALKQAVAEDGP